MKWLVALAFLLPGVGFAHGPHVHGKGRLDVAFDGAIGKLEFEAPAESIYGFEHEAKKKKDVTRMNQAFATLEKRIGDMVKFHESLTCEFKKTAIENRREGGKSHAEVYATFDVTCGRSPKGTTVRIAPAEVFKRLKNVDVTILIDDTQKSATAGSKGTAVPL